MNYIFFTLLLLLILLCIVFVLGMLIISRRAEEDYDRVMQDKIHKDQWNKLNDDQTIHH